MSLMLQQELDELSAIDTRVRTIEVTSGVGTGPTGVGAEE